MKLNCRPGDLAVIIASDPLTNPDTGGVLCDVLHAPSPHIGRVTFPDGTATTSTIDCPKWVIRTHRPISVTRFVDGRLILVTYAVCPDSKLRPIRPQADDGQDETLTWREVPTGVLA